VTGQSLSGYSWYWSWSEDRFKDFKGKKALTMGASGTMTVVKHPLDHP
jgi:hypothetical protein